MSGRLHAAIDHASAAAACACDTCQADARESVLLLNAGLWPASDSAALSPPALSPVAVSLPAAVERSTRALDITTFALASVLTPAALYFAAQAIPFVARAITHGGS